MKFNLPRQILDQKFFEIVAREADIQKELITSASRKQLKGIEAAALKIKKDTLPTNLVRRKLKNNLGYGIFLRPDSKPILRGEVIAPYSGILSIVPSNDPNETGYMFEVLSNIHLTKEDQLLIHPSRCYHPARLYSIQLDAQKTGNFTRFINHSEQPNIIAYLISSSGKNPTPIEVVYLAKKTIHPGEQLLVSYEQDGENNYWGPAKIKPFPMTPKTFTLSKDLKIL